MKNVLALFLLTLFLTGLAGCDAVRPLPARAGESRVLEVAVFEGGYGIHWHKKIARAYSAQEATRGVSVNLWGDPRVEEKVKPRILRGDPPDVIMTNRIPVWLLIGAGELLPFDNPLEQPAPGSGVPWRELFMPGGLETYTSGGRVYAVPSAFGAWACWYDARLFEEHGWQPPGTWAEFTKLCARIAAAGIAPIAFQGKYPVYAWYTYVSLVQRCGGLEAINRINTMTPGAFAHPDSVKAARLLQDNALHFYQKGAMAMTHTESQLQFVNNQAAMIFCGIWLENEMKDSIPPGFALRCFNIPAVKSGKGNPALCCGGGAEFLFVPSDARYPDLAFDFIRFMVSPLNAPDMGSSIGVISPLNDATPRDAVSPALQSALDMMEDAPGVFSVRLVDLLLEWTNQVLTPQMAALLEGDITPEAFCKALDDGIAAAKNNPDVIVPPYEPYDPTAYGETP